MELKDAVRSSFYVFLSYFSLVHSNADGEIARHLEMGKQFLAQGQFADALTHYHAAVEADPTNYQTLYRRATVYLAMGRSKSALPDLDRVVELKPDFIAARVQRGNVLFKQGELDAAERDYTAVLGVDPGNADARAKFQALVETRDAIENAKQMLNHGDHDSAVFYLGKAIDHCQWDATLYEKRAACFEAHGEPQKAVADLRAITKLVADSTEHYYKISKLLYAIGDLDESLSQVRECLKLNPDHKLCFPHYKKVKKMAKMREQLTEMAEHKQWMECLEKAEQILKAEPAVENLRLDVMRYTCKCNLHTGHLNEAIAHCTEILQKQNENDVDVLIDRAEAYIANEQFDEAIEDYQKAVNSNQDSRRAKEGLDKANKLKKQSQKRDYYKILGVRRNADKRDIMKAYRKLAQKWHPDNFSDDNEKKKAEAKFIDIASAKEVLTDPEKRQKFDQGVDPLDPEQQQHGGHPFHGFHHGFNPFGDGGGGGGYSFKFNF